MSIQSKLSITFILLLVFGVTAISSYSIVFIRGYLLTQSVEDMKADARQILLTFQVIPDEERILGDVLQETGRESRYDVSLFDSDGSLAATTRIDLGDDEITELTGPPFEIQERLLHGAQAGIEVVNRRELKRIYVFGLIAVEPGVAYFAEISRPKSEIFEPIRTIRWIIYSGMFISIAIILFVSFIFSQYLAKPILQITESARKVAEGDTELTLSVDRKDEFGTLAESINQMSERLRRDNEQLKNANERQKQFYADIAHEIRNPLHTVMGSLEMLQLPDLPDDKRQKYLRSAYNQTERIHHLFKDLMTLQRSDLDEHFVDIQPFDFQKLAQKMEQTYQSLMQEKNITLEIRSTPLRVLGDADKIEQVLDNLLLNALKFTNDGKVSLSWQTQNTNSTAVISVSDTGIGIPQEHIPHLFNRFYRTDKARARDSGGTGLGLAVVKSILDAHGSEIRVESKPGKGTRISFGLKTA